MEFIYAHRNDVRKWQQATLEIQQEIQQLFEKMGLACWCGGGTLIGAVRNKGFLYWDNDLDMFFMFKDYKRIILALLEENLFDKFDLYFFRYGYWQKHHNLTSLSNGDRLDEFRVDFEIEELSNRMFKLFAKTGIPIILYDNDHHQPEQYVKIKHRAVEHLTRYRLANPNQHIVNGATYSVMPNVCMLPMIEMRYTSYLMFIYRFMLNKIFFHLANFCQYPEVTLDKHCQLSVEPQKRARTRFSQRPTHKYSQKAKLLFSVLLASKFHFFRIRKRKMLKKTSGKVIAYKQPDFRFIVRPFLLEDVFPIQKVEFENVLMNVPHDTHNVLETQFGNYLKVPSVESRVAYPFFFEENMD